MYFPNPDLLWTVCSESEHALLENLLFIIMAISSLPMLEWLYCCSAHQLHSDQNVLKCSKILEAFVVCSSQKAAVAGWCI